MTRVADVPKFQELYETAVETFFDEEKVVTKHINVDDAPTEDLLYHLTDACDWIDVSLHSCGKDDEKPDSRQVGVLVHCVQGISRSGSIIVAYCKPKPPTSPLTSLCLTSTLPSSAQ